MRYSVGLDWGGTTHAVCVLDADGREVSRFSVAHTAEGLAELCRRLAGHAPPAEVPVAIERPSGLLVDTLVEAGHPVVPVGGMPPTPNVVKAARPRYRSSGAKSDGADAHLLADLLRTDGHRFAPLRPQSDEIRALRTLVRSRDDLVATRVALANQLRALLGGFWPGAAALFADIDSPIALAFLRRYPTPASAARLGEARMAAFLGRHAYSGRRSPGELIARLHGAPAGHAGKAEAEASGEVVAALVAALERLVAGIAALTERIGAAVAALPEGRVVMSFPRAGTVCAAQSFASEAVPPTTAELGAVRERFPSADALAVEAGVAPVTRQSGRSRSVVCRRACNRRLRAALTRLADNSRPSEACLRPAWAAGIYRRARDRGCGHPHAVRSSASEAVPPTLARAWARVLWRAWHDGRPYDPQAHAGARVLASA